MSPPEDRFDIKSWLVLADWYEEKKWDNCVDIIKSTIIKWIKWSKKLNPYFNKYKRKYCWENDELKHLLNPHRSIPKEIYELLLKTDEKLGYDKYYSSEEEAWNDLLLAWIEYATNISNSE